MWADLSQEMQVAVVGAAMAGVFGIAGAISGILFQRFLESRGRILFFILNPKLGYARTDNDGTRTYVENPDEATGHARLTFRLEIFNDSGVPTSLHSIQVVFTKGRWKRVVHSSVIQDWTAGRTYCDFDHLNLSPRELKVAELCCITGRKEVAAADRAALRCLKLTGWRKRITRHLLSLPSYKP